MEGVTIPIIDISGLRGSDPEAHRRVADEIRKACHEVGFMYVSGHGVPAEVLNGVIDAATDLFDLDMAEKSTLDATKSPVYRGYNSFEWPSEEILPKWRGRVEGYMAHLFKVAEAVMMGMALALHVDEDFFVSRCDDATAQMVLFKYLPSHGSHNRGCGAHTDCGFLTFLLQNQVQGLEVRTVTGQWVPASPVEGTLIVNLGDMMARWTNDFFKSTEHRVHSPPAKGGETRYSVAFFLNPNFHAQVECITSYGGEEEAKYPPVLAGHYLLKRLGLMWSSEDDMSDIRGKKEGKDGY